MAYAHPFNLTKSFQNVDLPPRRALRIEDTDLTAMCAFLPSAQALFVDSDMGRGRLIMSKGEAESPCRALEVSRRLHLRLSSRLREYFRVDLRFFQSLAHSHSPEKVLKPSRSPIIHTSTKPCVSDHQDCDLPLSLLSKNVAAAGSS